MADRIKVYEERTKKSLPVWAWLLPLLILVALLTYYLIHRRDVPAAKGTAVLGTAPAAGFPYRETFHFNIDKATLTPQGQATLHQAAAAMKRNVHLRLEGYTDSTGTTLHNSTLSQQRARTAYLKSGGIDGGRRVETIFAATTASSERLLHDARDLSRRNYV